MEENCQILMARQIERLYHVFFSSPLSIEIEAFWLLLNSILNLHKVDKISTSIHVPAEKKLFFKLVGIDAVVMDFALNCFVSSAIH